jgi:hypothetical protein
VTGVNRPRVPGELHVLGEKDPQFGLEVGYGGEFLAKEGVKFLDPKVGLEGLRIKTHAVVEKIDKI